MVQLRTIQRAFKIIKTLEQLDGAGPAALARELNLPKSTAHDYLRTLETTGYVIKSDGIYYLSYDFLATGKRLQYRNKLYQVARLELKALAREIDENVNVSIVEDEQWVLLDSVRGNRSFDLGVYPGLQTPLHTHAAAKSILAHLPEEQRETLFDTELEAVTEHTITDPEQLRSELSDIRDAGYAVDSDQQVVGMGTVAAPVLVEEDVVGSIAIVCPSGRLEDDEYRDTLTRKIRESADTIGVNYLYGEFSRG